MMKSNIDRPSALNVLTLLLAAIVLYGGISGFFGKGTTSVSAQSDMFLSRRIDAIEQRFYQIESRISRIDQQQMRPAGVSPPIITTSDAEITYLRSQIDSLRTRLGEAECGLLKLDERTLTAAQRRVTTTDPCRKSWGDRLTLSVRPGQ